MPKDRRRVAFVVRAFNCELAQINDQISTRIAGIGRLQFWKDCIEKVSSGRPPPQQPVALALDTVMRENCKLNKKWLMDMVESRAERLGDPAFLKIGDLEQHSQQTLGSCLFLILQSLNVKDLQADHVASHVAKACGIINCLRAVPILASRNKVVLPLELLAHHKVSQEDILRNKNKDNVKNLAHDLAGQSNIHLEHARKLKSQLPKEASNVFLCCAIVDYYLSLFQKVDFDLFHPNLHLKNSWLPWQLWWRKIRHTF